jgi:hypothetical protein
MRWRRLLSGPALALAAALAAASCASATAGTSNTSANTPALTVASITAGQAGQAFNAYVATTAKALRTDDGALALSVVTGVQRATLGHPSNDKYTYGKPTFYLPEPAGYPRFFVAYVTRTFLGIKPADGAVASVGGVQVPVDGPALMLFEQATAAGPWQLASASQLSAGTTLPRLAADKNGYLPQVPLTSTDLLAQPYATGPLQAAVVDDGPASAATKAVAAGPLTTGMYQATRARSGTGLQVPSGDVYQWAMEGTAYPAFTLRTASGGALVLYAMYLNSTVATPSYIDKANPVKEGPPIEVPQELSHLLPVDQPAPRVELEAQDLLSFAAIDPPAGTSKIQVIAIGGGLNYAASS